MRSNKYTGLQVYRPEWKDPNQLTNWLEREVFVGTVLNFPCGTSQLGDVRADVDESLSVDVRADLELPLEYFDEREFDTVYCDPPYDMYYNDQDWIGELWDIARRRLVLQTPSCRVLLNGPEKDMFLLEPLPGSTSRWITLIQVFSEVNECLDPYVGEL